MLERLLAGAAEITLGASAVILLLLALTPVLRKSFAAKWRYWVWMLVALRLAVPFPFGLPSAPVQVPAPPSALTEPIVTFPPAPPREALPVEEGPVLSPAPSGPVVPEKARGLSLVQITALIWLTGVAVFLLWQFVSYGIFLRTVRRWGRAAENPLLLEKFQLLQQEMHIRKRISLVVCRRVGSPMLTGFFRPCILLPREDWDAEEAEFILRHECTHWRRRDLWYKLLMTLATAIHWFNPLVWQMRRQADRDVEISCDDAVLRGADLDTRRRYSDAILAVTRQERGSAAAFSTYFKGTKQTVKQRFANIFDRTKKHRGIAAFCIAGALVLLSGGLVACSLSGEGEGNPAGTISGGTGAVELSGFFHETAEELVAAMGEPESVNPMTSRAELYNYEDGGLWFTLFDGRVSAVNIRFERVDSRYRLFGIGTDSLPADARALGGKGMREEDGYFTLYLDGNRCEFIFQEDKSKSAAATYRPEEPEFPLSLGKSEFAFPDGSRVEVELRMTGGQVYRSSDAGYVPGGNIQGDETYDGSFELVTRKEGKEQTVLPLEGSGFNFHGPVSLEGRDYIGDGSLQFTLGAWGSSSLTDFSLYRLDSRGGLSLIQTITADGPGKATTLFSPAPGGFYTGAYNNADGRDYFTWWVWDGKQFTDKGEFFPNADSSSEEEPPPASGGENPGEASRPDSISASPIQLELICGGPAKDDLTALLGQPERTEETEAGAYWFYPFLTVCLQNGNVAGIQVEYPEDWQGTAAERYQVLKIGPADNYKDVTEKLDITYASDLDTVPTFQSYPWHDGFMAWFFYDRETGRVRAIQVGMDEFLFRTDPYFFDAGVGNTD